MNYKFLTVASDKIARATQAVAVDISKAVDRVWHIGLLHKFKSYGISVEVLGLISSFLSNRRLGMESLHKNIQLMLEFLEAQFLVLHFSYYTLITFLMLLVILLSMLMILLSILNVSGYLICGNNVNWLLNLNLIHKRHCELGQEVAF